MKFLVLAGTEDGRKLAKELEQRGHRVLVSTLTAYGADLVEDSGLPARYGALEEESLRQLLEDGCFDALVDSTHPYALKIKELAQRIATQTGIPYFRWIRSTAEIPFHPLIHRAKDIPSAAAKAIELGQKIFLTTGSNNLPEWIKQPSLQNAELYVRVLPTSQVLLRCESLGLKPKQIIAAQGPFSKEWNKAVFQQLKIDVVISKESGPEGGTTEKVQACLELNIPLIILERPESSVPALSLSRFINEMEERLCARKLSS